MDYVDLNRSFVPVKKDEEPSLGVGLMWGRRVAGWLDWSDLLEYRRVVLLAEASSGKSVEFRHQAEALFAEGKAAFFIPIEGLADEEMVACLDPSAISILERWCQSVDEEAWFFLDSVDEARLNHKSIDRALRRCAQAIGHGLGRAHIYVSCRVSDWKGDEDRESVTRWLPLPPEPRAPEIQDAEAALLDPLFKDQHEVSRPATAPEPNRAKADLLMVQLVPLSAEQWQSLASATGVSEPSRLVKEIQRNGLDALTERPGDLLDLIEYWKEHGSFGSLAEMTEHGVTRKLLELDRYRLDNRALSPEKARLGAERISAALTLTKSTRLRAPGHGVDPTLSLGALEPADVLGDWSDAERNALTRRGVFAPSTYGRVRFHHRGTQEHLMASWLDRLLRSGCPRSAVWELLFAEPYGVKTLVPSLAAPAAWLALHHPDIREEILQREPLVLLRHGDPRTLPLDVKERLLLHYARRHATGEISDDDLDNRAFSMFATPGLSNTICQCWDINKRVDFRTDLLRLIREGAIRGCTHLARGVVTDCDGNDHQQIVALQALEACGDAKGLADAARWLTEEVEGTSARVAAGFALVLFPQRLTVDGLLELIAQTREPRHEAFGSFAYCIDELWKQCPAGTMRERLLSGLAELLLAPPFESDHRAVSAAHYELAKRMAPIAREAVVALGDDEPSHGLLRLLVAVERAGERDAGDQECPTLGDVVRVNARLQRQLFWADAVGTHRDTEDRPTRFWHIRLLGETLWRLGPDDLEWLYEDLVHRVDGAERQIALSAIVATLRETGGLGAAEPRLRELVSGCAELEADLAGYLNPPPESEGLRRFHRDERHYRRKLQERDQVAKGSWVRFCAELKADPSVLNDSELLADWRAGAFRLHYLTNWLSAKTKTEYRKAALQWQLLEDAFGCEVASAYCDGMKVLWRVTLARRPTRKKGGAVVVQHTTLLALAGVALEAAEDADWAVQLSATEVTRAAEHGCVSEQGYPEWLESLCGQHESIVLPFIWKTLRREWSGRIHARTDFLSYYSHADRPIGAAVQSVIFEVVSGRKPRDLEVLDCGLRLLQVLELNAEQRRRTAGVARRRIRAIQRVDGDGGVLRYAAMLFVVDPVRATRELVEWLERIPGGGRDDGAAGAFATLFSRHDGIATTTVATAPVAVLEALVRLAYQYVRPEDDMVHQGAYTPGTRDRAEEGRNALLSVLVNRAGPEAFKAMRALAADTSFGGLSTRLVELARGKAENDAELPAWTPTEVIGFERCHMSPAKTGDALLRVVMGVLGDIQSAFSQADATSRPLLERAEDEEEVQAWLAEQMNAHSRGRYHAHREARVAQGDKPDIVVSSTAAVVEVAIEVKHGGKGWTVRDFERALTKQLAERYIKPASRRWGVLVISNHGRRTWRHPESRERMTFNDVIQHLQVLAQSVVGNRFGSVEVRAFGIDASPLGDS